jgi:hypothetical protein
MIIQDTKSSCCMKKSLGVPRSWFEGIIFVYTNQCDMYFDVDEDEFKMALIIRDKGFLELIKMLLKLPNLP